MSRFCKVLLRKKIIAPEAVEESRLSRVLNTFDLTALGVGSTLGVGVYVLAGHVAKEVAGPAVVLSFLLAAIASVFAGLCYAEFGARVPKAGSAYIYSYVCVGEFVAFIIGWNLILEYVIGSASVARGLTLYLDTLLNNTLQETFREIAPINIAYLSSYFDFFSFGISIILAGALAFGLKESSVANNIFTTINVLVVLFVVIAGSLKADPGNWNIPANTSANSTDVGKGGFFPFGIEGMIKGAATCFYGFVGFDCIATTGEEVKNPKKAIPISIILSLFIIFLAYFGTSTVITLMVPYYLQNPNAPIPHAFDVIGWEWAKWIVAIGAIFGLCASLFGAMFPLPRIIYAMGSDGLVFKFLAKVHPRFQTPVMGTLLAGLLTGLMAAMFELKQLVNMMSIGTLLAYTIVAASVLILRYKQEETHCYSAVQTTSSSDSEQSENDEIKQYNDETDRRFSTNAADPSSSDDQELVERDNDDAAVTCCAVLKQILNCFRKSNPTKVSQSIVSVQLFVYCILCILISLMSIYWKNNVINGDIWAISVASVLGGLTVFILISIATQPTSKKQLSFKVPMVPLIPALSILVNIYLMLMLDTHTWIRFGVWMAVGIPMYIYCVQDSCHVKTNSAISNYSNNIKNGDTSNKINGITNAGFTNDMEKNSFNNIPKSNDVQNARNTKKGIAPLPPQKNKDNNVIEIQPEAVIAQLDEILERADSNIEKNLLNGNRKVSDGSVSNASFSVEPQKAKSVVADVHCVYDPSVVMSDVPPFVHPALEINRNVENVDRSDIITEPLDLVPVDGVIVVNSLQKQSNDNNLVLFNSESDFVSDKSSGKNTQGLVSKDDLSDFKHYDSLTTTSLKSVNSQDGFENVENENDINSGNISKDLFDLPQEVEEPEKETKDIIDACDVEHSIEPSTSNINISPSSDMYDISLPTTPTELALKSVTLRKTPKKESQNADPSDLGYDDNLKAGSVEYNNFLAKLNSRLSSKPITPTYLPPMVVDKNKLKTSIEKNDNDGGREEFNENVIEDNIDQQDAKEKLKIFYQNNFVHPFNISEKLNKNIDNKDDLNEKTDVSEENITVSTVLNNTDGNKELDNHRKNMQNVFRSINLKKRDSTKKDGEDSNKTRRLSKTLGPNFMKSDDKVLHIQKMDDVFKTILLRRKDSIKDKESSSKSETE